jgi:hypothetical protein
MNGMITRATRILAVPTLALAAIGAAAGGAQAAGARPQLQIGCQPAVESLTGNSAQVVASFTETCIEPNGVTRIIDFPVSLSEMINGSWVLLVSGEGVAAHECVGTVAHEYLGAGHTATFACG